MYNVCVIIKRAVEFQKLLLTMNKKVNKIQDSVLQNERTIHFNLLCSIRDLEGVKCVLQGVK